jgi:hypothetical protein
MIPLGAANWCIDAEGEILEAEPNNDFCWCWDWGWGWALIMGSIERLWDVGIPALSTSVAEVLRVRWVLFQVSPVD